VETATDSGVTVATGTNYRLEVFHRPDNSVAFFLNGSYVTEHTSNIHDGFAYNQIALLKTLGTTARTINVYAMQFLESRL
jgi:hypothetical protein